MQVATGTLLVVMGAGQVVVVYWLATVGPDAVQVATGTLLVLLVPQVVAVQLLPADAAVGVQTKTPVVTTASAQVVAWYPLDEDAVTGVQVCTAVGPLRVVVVQLVVV